MSRKGIRDEGKFEHTAVVDVFNEDEIKKVRREAILNIARKAVRSFAALENKYPTALIVGYEESCDIQNAISAEMGGSYISRDALILNVDGYPIKVKQGCDNKDSEYSILYWEQPDPAPVD